MPINEKKVKKLPKQMEFESRRYDLLFPNVLRFLGYSNLYAIILFTVLLVRGLMAINLGCEFRCRGSIPSVPDHRC